MADNLILGSRAADPWTDVQSGKLTQPLRQEVRVHRACQPGRSSLLSVFTCYSNWLRTDNRQSPRARSVGLTDGPDQLASRPAGQYKLQVSRRTYTHTPSGSSEASLELLDRRRP